MIRKPVLGVILSVALASGACADGQNAFWLILPEEAAMPLFPADVKNDISVVWGWDSQAQAYKYYTPQDGYNSTLTTVGDHTGYWVYAKDNVSFTVTGTTSSDIDLHLNPGWNLVGSPADSQVDASQVYDSAQVVWGYQNGAYELYTPQAGYTSTLSSLDPDSGYWVYY